MLAIIKKRFFMLILVIIGVSLITFIMTNVIPGDPARMIVGPHASQETYQSVRKQLGLNDPIYVQYFQYMMGIFHGNLGTSIRTGQPVIKDLMTFFPATLELVFYAFVFAIVIGIAIGILTAVKNNTKWDYIGRIFSTAGVTIPVFLSGLIVIIVFYGKLGWFPDSGRLDLSIDPPPIVTGMYTIDSLLTGRWQVFVNSLWHLTMPAIILGYVQMATITRQVRSSMIDVLNEEYIRTARANGLSKWFLIFRYALPNALIPTITVIGVSIGSLLGGAVITEVVFNWPGMGKYVVDSIASLDFPAIMGFTLLIAVGYVFINLIVDILYLFLNPQIRE